MKSDQKNSEVTKNTFKYDQKKNPAKKESKSEFIIKYTLDI